jgi:vitamin B12 transporter
MSALICLVTCLYIISPGVIANESQSTIENIVVTASRVDTPLDRVGSSMTVLTADQLENNQNIFLAEILREVPGLAISKQGVAGSSTQVRIRGSEGNHVLVFIDGIEANDLSQGSEFNFAHLTNQDIERVEVVRGPQSALWGSDALGGVINIVSRKADRPLSASLKMEAGSFNTTNSGFNLASKSDRFHVKFGTQYIDSKGNNISRHGNEDDGYRNLTHHLIGGLDVTESLKFNLVMKQTEATNEYDEIDFLNSGLPVDADLETETEQFYGKLEARWNLINDRWEHRLSYDLVDTENQNFNQGVIDSSADGKRQSVNYQTSFSFDTVIAEQILTLAYDHEKEEYSQRGQSFGTGFNPNKDLETTTDSVIVEYRLDLWNQLHISASARNDNNDEFDDTSTYRLTTSYSPGNKSTRLHAAYGTGVKNPTFTERFGYFDGFLGNPDLQPEESKGWEAGIEQKFFDNRLEVDLTYFDETLEDEINGFVFDPATFLFTSANMDGESERSGYEIAASYQISENLYWQGTYTSLDAAEPDYVSDTHLEEIRRPSDSASMSINYTFADEKANLYLSASYTGDQLDNYFPPYPLEPERVTLDSFTLVNVSGSYQISDSLTVFARIENLLDEDYEEIYGFSSQGQGAYAGIRYNFN